MPVPAFVGHIGKLIFIPEDVAGNTGRLCVEDTLCLLLICHYKSGHLTDVGFSGLSFSGDSSLRQSPNPVLEPFSFRFDLFLIRGDIFQVRVSLIYIDEALRVSQLHV